MLTTIAIANIILWSGIMIFLLFRLMGNHGKIEEQLTRLEEQIPSDQAE